MRKQARKAIVSEYRENGRWAQRKNCWRLDYDYRGSAIERQSGGGRSKSTGTLSNIDHWYVHNNVKVRLISTHASYWCRTRERRSKLIGNFIRSQNSFWTKTRTGKIWENLPHSESTKLSRIFNTGARYWDRNSVHLSGDTLMPCRWTWELVGPSIVFCVESTLQILQWRWHPQRAYTVGIWNICDSQPISPHISQMVQDRRIVTVPKYAHTTWPTAT